MNFDESCMHAAHECVLVPAGYKLDMFMLLQGQCVIRDQCSSFMVGAKHQTFNAGSPQVCVPIRFLAIPRQFWFCWVGGCSLVI